MAGGTRSTAPGNRAEPIAALEEAWRLHARTRAYAGRTARRYRVAAAILEDVDSAVELVDESLGVLRRLGPIRWRTPEYQRGLCQRICYLRDVRRFEEAIRMSAEVLSVAANARGDDALVAAVLVQYARAVSDAGRPEEALEAASIGLQRTRRLTDPGQLHLAVQTYGHALLLAGRYDQAPEALQEALSLSQAWTDSVHDSDRAIAVLDRIIYADALNKSAGDPPSWPSNA